MIEWSEEQKIAIESIRRFIDDELLPIADQMENDGLPPYEFIRNMYKTFGLDVMAEQRFDQMIAKAEGQELSVEEQDDIDMFTLLTIELCKHSTGVVTAMGVSNLAGSAIISQGTLEQKKRWARDIVTMRKVGAWAITEPGSGSDAFGGMKSTATLQDDGTYVLKGSKTFITNGPYADTIVFICKLFEEGVDHRDRKIMTFVLDKGMEGLDQSKPFKKMGQHSSPTGQLFLDDVVVGPDRVLGGVNKDPKKGGNTKSDPKETFATERAGSASMALGIVEQCLNMSVEYAKERVQWNKPIGQYQLIQQKLANMEVARFNIQNMIFNYLECRSIGRPMSFAEASAMKLYATQQAVEVASEAIQIFGGNGYMQEYKVEQLYRDARILRIYGGTDEMQIRAIAKDLLTR